VRIGVAGHQALPESTLPAITRAVRAQLKAAADVTGVSSLAAGADQLFARLCSISVAN
jgi:methylmalonyl-CoA mutase cobalamin-binding subunit